MAYLPASRAVDTVGLHPMFRGRVSGVGDVVTSTPEEAARLKAAIDAAISRATGTAAPSDLYPTYPGWDFTQPVSKILPVPDRAPTPAPESAPATPKPSGSALPLLLGAAYLLLS